ncbi:hypothetical protein AGOR_G00019040 [Albula goreensis]|uniref:Rho GTPase-activating protein 20 n=1 Tax=Albula goreensis TaxID=1534307 RepID=A0A8T3E0H5_9TELE|nr:hypothetical protein AGOR_G00019040 [Albula goreensis]
MTPQQNNDPHFKKDNDELKSRIEEREKKMKTTVQRRRSTPSAITKALSKSKSQSRDGGTGVHRNRSLIQAFVSQSSSFIMDEQVHLTTGLQTQERHLFLFSDTLIIAKTKSSSSLKLKQQVRLSEMWLASCVEEVAERKLSSETSFVIGWPTTNYVVTLSSSEMKEKWLSALQWNITKLKCDEYPHKISWKMMVLGVGNNILTATVQVDNKDTAQDVIKMTVQQLGISGSLTDYHLWVISGKEEAPYPLIGHELPFSIIMSSLRDAVDQPCLANNNILTPDGTLALDQLPKGNHVQFILKLRPAARSHIRADSFQKHFKRKKSLIDWALRRGNGSQSTGQLDTPTTPRKLFGHSLSSICHDGNLPKPIMDMLYLLYQEGPTTKGIFRRSANAKTCKELKERLNAGDAVQMEGESVFVAASVITDFLRNVPGSVLTTELYSKWMEVTEINNTEEKKKRKRLLDDLPDANVTLLRHLFGLLHHIQNNSEENQMNAFNLALCIAPNMLWLPVPAGPEEESKSTRKVARLIQFLIENSPSIFDEDFESLFTHLQSDQRPVEDVIDESFHQLYSSDECDSEQDRFRRLPSHERDSFFLPLNDLVLTEETEIWSLLDEMDSFKKQHLMEDGGYSCGNLDNMSFRSDGSICSLVGTQDIESSRGRCSSEPSVCVSSQLLPQLHAPVARQSSCDAAVMRCQTDGAQQGHKLCVDSARGAKGNTSPRTGSRSKYTFWRSPQITSRFKHATHRVALSNRSSFSSLSSTATTPSASSLSSLDSALSYCSDSVFSPTDGASLPFLLGPSARVRPLTPDVSGGFSTEWSRTLPASLGREPCNLDWCNEYDENDEENSVSGGKIADVASILTSESDQSPTSCPGSWGAEERDPGQDPGSDIDGAERNASDSKVADLQIHLPNEMSGTRQPKHQSRETAFKHIQLTRPNSLELKTERVKRTKITFYMASNTVAVRRQTDPNMKQHDHSVVVPNANAGPLDSSDQECQMVQVHIPQTVFYGQDAPLVLQSVVARNPSSPKQQCRQVKTDVDGAPLSEQLTEGSSAVTSPAKTNTKTTNSIRHTIRIRLPAAVRNTVKEYFNHSDNKSSVSEAKAVEKELVRSRLEWQKKNLMEEAKESFVNLPFGEESFV